MQAFSPIPQPSPRISESHSGPHVRIAYFIMIHHKPEVFKSMFEKIYTRDQFYLIHIDKKAKQEFIEEIQLYIVHFPNVYILDSMNIVSGGFNIVQAELNAMEFLLNVSKEWDYFINLSGEDYPLKSQNIIRKFLTTNKGRNYLFYYDQKFYRPDTLKRIQNHFTELAYVISSFIYKRSFMKDVIPYIGGKWFMFTRETCLFLTNNKMVMDFEDYYLHTFLPADSFFQTVLMNTSFNDIIVNDDKRAVLETSFFQNTQNTFNYIQSLKSGNQLFIRKVNKKTDESIRKYIEESYLTPLPYINEVERELKRNNRQNN
ncbi:beta-1,6-N-acetylglucosaminyltransferase [Chryseobacterium cucumeris]|uniref:beta-1,6-N-acetylglucosaminyltransferase n=1 Tax=Chryseobacterium TaxID=59732 RepID=UPI000787BBE1|nr:MULTISPECIES: beta-1,6-N-acetylglucosaminyltransferase [Chryseobacterium]KYH06861.1 glycosyl transferase [Chryseobacterium cucumeris]RKE82360.1 core-2/I-Branching enzyme [Chryseobacterium sp. AG363]WNI38202.1 beta-1,6-N-acetylglucosaminyltransferase [Chryseobacterium sp. SG20098]